MNNITKFISLFYFINSSEYAQTLIESRSSIPSDSDVEYTPVHVLDPKYTGEILQSEACFKHECHTHHTAGNEYILKGN